MAADDPNKDVADNLDDLIDKQDKYNKALETTGKILTDIREIQLNQYEQEEARLTKLVKLGDEDAARQLRALENTKATAVAMDDHFAALTGVSDKWKQSIFHKLTQPGGMQGMVDSFNRTFTAANIAHSAISKVTEATMTLMWKQDDALVKFNVSTGAARMYGDTLLETENTMYSYGVSTEEAAIAMGALVSGVKGLNTMTAEQQLELTQTTALLEKYGVGAGTTAQNVQFLTAAMGFSATEAGNFQEQMFLLAQDIGLPPEEMARSFEAARPYLAKFGKESTEVFKKLAVNAKAAGMEVDQILNITEKFDTFEGAAQAVGSLNAVLGGPYLSSLQMVEATDPTERMRLLSGAINEAGLSFEDMSYYQRKTMAEAAGFKDVEELALAMKGGFDQVAPSVEMTEDKMEELKKQTADFNTFTEEGAQMLRMFALQFAPVVSWMKKLMQGVQDLNTWMGGKLFVTISIGIGIIAGLVAVMKALNFVQSIGKALQIARIALWAVMHPLQAISAFLTGNQATAKGDSEDAQKNLNEATSAGIDVTRAALGPNKALTKSMKARAKETNNAAGATGKFDKAAKPAGKTATSIVGPILALGAAFLMLGAGVFLAASGIALMALGLSSLDEDQVRAFGYAMAALTIIFTGFMLVMAVAISTGVLPATAAGFLAMGAAVLMLGAGVAIAAGGMFLLALGISKIIGSFGKLFTTVNPATVTLFAASLAALASSMGALMPMLPGFAALGLALASFAFAMSLIDVSSLAPLTAFFTSLSSALDKDIEKLVAMQTALENIVAAVNSVDDTEKLVAVQHLIESVNSSAAANKNSEVSALNTAAGAGAGAGKDVLSKPLEVKLTMNQREMGSWAWKSVSDFLNYNGTFGN